jgi:PTS system galactitol-specific IIB component
MMSGRKRILVVCGSGIATSTVVAQKVQQLFEQQQMVADIIQCSVSELPARAPEADFAIATTTLPAGINLPVISGIPFLTGVGTQRAIEQIMAFMKGEGP